MNIVFSAPTDNLQRSQAFYEGLFSDLKLDPAQDQSLSAKIATNDVHLRIGPRHDKYERMGVHFHVKNLDAAVAQVEKLGGKILKPPSNMKQSTGKPAFRFAFVADPDSNGFGLVEIST